MIKILSLFSGIGAFEKALTRLKIQFEVVNYCEIDNYASKSYSIIHNENENKNLWDITKVNEKELLDFDLMTWGFPCTDISQSGKQKGLLDKNGNKTRSGLYYDGLRILQYKKPKYSIIENVSALTFKKFKKDFEMIKKDLREAGYNNYYKVLNAKDYGIPQNRERIFIVSIRKDIDDYQFEFPKKQKLNILLKDLLEENADKKYYLSDKMMEGLIERKKRHKGNGHGFGFTISNNITNTISAKYYKDGSECLINELNQIGYINKDSDALRIYDSNMAKTLKGEGGGWGAKTGLYSVPLKYLDRNQKNFPSDYSMCIDTLQTNGIMNGNKIRRLTPLECFRLMGFDDEDYYKCKSINISDTQLYKQCGNSIVVNVLEAILYKLFINRKIELKEVNKIF